MIPEEFETSVEIFARVLKRYLVPEDEIEKLVAEVRADTYGMLRSFPLPSLSVCDLETYLHDLEVSALRVGPGSPLEGKSLAEVELRKRHGVTVVAIRRGQESMIDPDPHLPIQREDVLVMIARAGHISELVPLVKKRREERGLS